VADRRETQALHFSLVSPFGLPKLNQGELNPPRLLRDTRGVSRFESSVARTRS